MRKVGYYRSELTRIYRTQNSGNYTNHLETVCAKKKTARDPCFSAEYIPAWVIWNARSDNAIFRSSDWSFAKDASSIEKPLSHRNQPSLN